jgi:FG-GAP repeat protein
MSVLDARRSVAASSVTILLAGVLIAIGLDLPSAPPMAHAAATCPAGADGRPVASAAARRCGARVLVADATDENSQTFANPDGTFTWESSVRSRFARNAAGRWVTADATLVANADGTVSPRAATFPIVFSGGGGGESGPLVSATREGRELSMRWKGALPTPVLAGNVATYAEVLPGVDLRMIAGVDGFSEHVVVKNRAAARAVAELRLGLAGDGLTVRRDDTGGMRALDPGGHTVFASGTPLMWDSSDRPARATLLAAGKYNEAGDVVPRTKRVGLRLDGGDVVLNPDQGLLADAAAVYPVVIDPTVVGGRNHWTELSKSDPGRSYYDAPDGTFSSTDGTNGLARVGLSDWQSPVFTMRPLFEMSTAGLQGKGKVTSAVFRLAQRWSGVDCNQGPGAVGLYWTTAITPASTWNASWNLDGTGWMRQIGSTSAAFRSDLAGATCGPNDVTFDITAHASAISLGCCSAVTLGLKAIDESNHNSWKRYLNDAANSPTLIVTYDATPVVGARSTVPATTCVTGASRPMLGTLTPTLSAVVTDSESQPLNATFEWWPAGGSAAIGSATVNVAGDTASQQIPGGQLAGGGAYQWRVTVSDGSTSATSDWCEFGTAVLDPAATGCPATLTPGDLNGDGVRDRVIGDPKAGAGGQVYVIDGATGAARTLQEGAEGVPGAVGDNDQFGGAVTVYDANRDGCADVAVGAPLKDYNGVSDSGAVYLLYGSPAGLAKGPPSMTVAQGVSLPNGRGTVPETPESGDWFGHSLSGGVTANGEPFLIIGAPGEDTGGAVDAGTAHYLRGAVDVKFDGHSPQGPETDDRSGTSVASTAYQFAVASPGEAAGAGTEFSGSVCVLNHNSGGTAPTGIRCFVQGDDTYGADQPERGDGFGTSIAMVPYRQAGTPVGNPSSLLLVGVPGEDIGTVVDAGMVQEYLVTTTGGQHLGTVGGGTGGVGEGDQAGAYFGRQVVAVNLSPDTEASGSTVLVGVGLAGKDRGSVRDSGAVRVFGGGTNILGSSVLVERAAGALPGTPLTQELIGGWLASDGTNLLVPSVWGNRAVYAIPWSGLASGNAAPSRAYIPGQGGIPAAVVAFGTAIG